MGQPSSKQGLVLISMSHGFSLLSSIKSKPKISKLFCNLAGSKNK